MRQAMTLDPQIKLNPLYRKMRERFTYNMGRKRGRMTIGELMLHKAERDGYCELVCQEPVAQTTPKTKPAKAVAPKKEAKQTGAFKRFIRSNAISVACIALSVCAILVLSLMIPFLPDSSILSENVSAAGSEDASTSAPVVETVPVEQESTAGSSFANVMDAFSFDFDN